MAKGFVLAWLMVALVWLPVAQAETPVPDSELSSRLTDYLHAHRLPLVGAQVLNSSGGRSVMLYGYTATDFGKGDAEAKAHRFLKDNGVAVNNLIKVRPELSSMKSPARRGSSSYGAGSAEAPPPDVNAYKDQQQDEAQQQYLNQQAQAYMNQGNTAGNLASMLVPLLGLGLGIGIGGGSSFGMGVTPGFGGFGGGSFSSSPYGSPYGGYGSPYGSSPYGSSPYGPNYPYP